MTKALWKRRVGPVGIAGALLGIGIVVIVISRLMQRLGTAVDYKTDIEMRAIEQAVFEWMAEIGSGVPSSIEGLLAGEGGFLRVHDGEPITDPWGRAYGFARVADGSVFMVFNLGSEGVPGGSGEAADQVRLCGVGSMNSALIGHRGER